MDDPRKSNRIEDIQRKLYSKHYRPKHIRAKLRDKEYDLNKDWGDENNTEEVKGEYWGPGGDKKAPVESKRNKYIPVFIIAMLFFFGSLGYALYVFNSSNQTVSARDVEVKVVGPVSIGAGEPLSLDVIVENNNNVALELVDLIIQYPVGTKNADDLVTDMTRFRTPLGDIPAGSVERKTVTAALFGPDNSSQNIDISVEYRLPGSNAIFEQDKSFDIVLTEAPIKIIVNGLREISSGQELELTATLTSNSVKPLRDVLVKVKYPFGFTYTESNILPQLDNSIWYFDSIDPEEEIQLVIKGNIEGQNEEDRVFRFTTGTAKEDEPTNIEVVWNEVLHETTISKSFANLDISLNGSYDELIKLPNESKVTGNVRFGNNTNDTIRNSEITLSIEGNVIDESSVRVENGFYRSSDNTIVWNSEFNNEFRDLDPRESYSLRFSFELLPLTSQDQNILDPELKLTARASGVRVSEDDVEEEILADSFATIRVNSNILADVYTTYTEGPFTNTGPYPPKVDEETTYTLVFSLGNSTNNLENVRLEGTLPSYVKWNNLSSESNVTYDSVTRRLVWDVGNLKAGVGFLTSPLNMYTNVTLIPSISQVSTSPVLINDVRIVGYDTFTGDNVIFGVEGADTKIYNESTSSVVHTVIE